MPLFSPDELAQWSGGAWTQAPVGPLQGAGHDTRALPEGCLYVALKGERCDGHDFVADAFSKGAAAALVERAWAGTRAAQPFRSSPLLVVEDSGRTLGALAAGWRRKLDIWMAGVTGSVGKTTVKDMLADMLGRVRNTARTHGNWNNAVGLPLSLLAMPETSRAGVFEIGMNRPGEMAPLCEILRPDTGVVTTIAPVHIEFFPDLEALADEKAELVRALPANGLAVLNRDSPYFERMREQAPCRTIGVSLKDEKADYLCLLHDPARGRFAVVERATGERHAFTLRIPGIHAGMNATLAAAMARQADVAWPEIVAALEDYVSAPMRWETVEMRGVRLINDAYNANPESMRAAIRTFAESAPSGGRWLVLGDMLELGAVSESEHRDLGDWLTQGERWQGLIAVGRLAACIAEGAVGAGFDGDRIFCCATAAEAGRIMAERLRTGDSVLLKASRGVRLEDALRIFDGDQHENGR